MENEKVTIRRIEEDDNEGVYKLIQGILESFQLDKPGTAYYDPYLSKLSDYYAQFPNGAYWVITIDNKVFGGIGIAPFGDYKEIAEVQKFYLSKDLQGLGYGRKLYDVAEHFAREIGYQKLYIETIDTLSKANDIYKHLGFIELNEPLKGSEHGLMNIWLEKELS